MSIQTGFMWILVILALGGFVVWICIRKELRLDGEHRAELARERELGERLIAVCQVALRDAVASLPESDRALFQAAGEEALQTFTELLKRCLELKQEEHEALMLVRFQSRSMLHGQAGIPDHVTSISGWYSAALSALAVKRRVNQRQMEYLVGRFREPFDFPRSTARDFVSGQVLREVARIGSLDSSDQSAGGAHAASA